MKAIAVQRVRWLSDALQKGLNKFYWFRNIIATAITYASIRLFGSEVTWRQVLDENFVSSTHTDRDLSAAEDLELILVEAKSCLMRAEARRVAIADKCKTLLALSSFILTVAGIVLPRLTVDELWVRALFFVAVLVLLNAVILLAIFFGVRRDMWIDISNEEVKLPADDLKKCLINSYFQCQTDLDNRVDYLVEVYKAARFFFLLALSLLVLVFSILFFQSSNDDLTDRVANKLLSDGTLLQQLRDEAKALSNPDNQVILDPYGNLDLNPSQGESDSMQKPAAAMNPGKAHESTGSPNLQEPPVSNTIPDVLGEPSADGASKSAADEK